MVLEQDRKGVKPEVVDDRGHCVGLFLGKESWWPQEGFGQPLGVRLSF